VTEPPKSLKNWFDDGGHCYPVLIEWGIIDGRYEPTRVTVSGGAGRKVDAQLLRRLPFGRIVDETRAQQKELATWAKRRMRGRWRKEAEQVRQRWGPQRGVPLAKDDLQMVADVYEEARLNARPVTAAVADTFNVSKSTAGKRIMQARAAGLLDNTGRTR
jgi:hypothetical protein